MSADQVVLSRINGKLDLRRLHNMKCCSPACDICGHGTLILLPEEGFLLAVAGTVLAAAAADGGS